MIEKYLTVDDVAALLQVSNKTVFNLRKLGLPSIKKGRVLRFDKSEVDAWLKENRK